MQLASRIALFNKLRYCFMQAAAEAAGRYGHHGSSRLRTQTWITAIAGTAGYAFAAAGKRNKRQAPDTQIRMSGACRCVL